MRASVAGWKDSVEVWFWFDGRGNWDGEEGEEEEGEGVEGESLDTAMRFQAITLILWFPLPLVSEGASRIQYAKLRMPMSILRIRLGD